MNPADLGMFWMNQYAQAQERMVIDDSTSYYAQSSIGMSVLDDLSQQSTVMDMNPLSMINSEFTAATGIAVTPDIFASLPTTFPPHLQEEQPRIHDHYGVQSIALGDAVQNADGEHGDGTSNRFVLPTREDNTDNAAYDDDDDRCTTPVESFDECHTDQRQLIGNGDDVEDDQIDGSDSSNSNSLDDDMLNAENGTLMHDDGDPFTRRTRSTQTNRKIKPVKRPGLVLKTPIAYQPCLDPSVIPIQRDGMAVCERCGAIGVKHSFYTKERRFCSMACARGDYVLMHLQSGEELRNRQLPGGMDVLETTDEMDMANSMEMNTTTVTTASVAVGPTLNAQVLNDSNDIEAQLNTSKMPNYRFKLTTNGQRSLEQNPLFEDCMDVTDTGAVLYRDILFEEEVPQLPKLSTLEPLCPQEEKIITVRRKPAEHANSYDWLPLLAKTNFYAAPVTCFRHAPGYDAWDRIEIGMKVEVENTDCDTPDLKLGLSPHSFWVATVLRLCGYKALLRYEGFDDECSHDFWANLCSSEVHSVGWCAQRGKPLIPPRTIEKKYAWHKYLQEQLTGALTLPSSFYNKINDSSQSRFRCGLQLEIVNKNRISEMTLGRITKIVGKRLLVRYFDSQDDNGFWVHEDSPLIHPVGWSVSVGHSISAPAEYMQRMLLDGHDQVFEVQDDDAIVDLFKMNFSYREYFLDGKVSGFRAGMKLEAVDPLNLSSICVATVIEVLKCGYMMIRIDTYDPDVTGADLFCYHEKSACIFPAGFCQANKLSLTPPKGYDTKTFSWTQYLRVTNSIAASDDLFYLELPTNGFKDGMKIECADLMDPRLVCVATIVKIVGRVMRVHFDGWEDEFDQWLDCESPDCYPVGWCVMVGHKLEAPKPIVVQKVSPKPMARKGRRKKGVKADGKINKPRSNTPTVKIVKKELIEPQKFDESLEYHNENSMKTESTQDGDDDDEFSHDGYSHSMNSLQSTSLPPTPEPNDAQLWHPIRPSSKSSSLSMNSGTATSSPPPERKATSYINNTSNKSSIYIPCLITSSTSISQGSANDELLPDTWSVFEVGQFLRINDCAAHCDTFAQNSVDGKRLLELSNDEIVQMFDMRVGPAVKIENLIQQLKVKMKSSHRSSTTKTKKYS